MEPTAETSALYFSTYDEKRQEGLLVEKLYTIVRTLRDSNNEYRIRGLRLNPSAR